MQAVRARIYWTSHGEPFLIHAKDICRSSMLSYFDERGYLNSHSSLLLLQLCLLLSRVDCRFNPQACSMCLNGDAAVGFGIFGGNACFCVYNEEVGNYLEGRTPGICDSPCAGDTSVAMCGGDNAFDLYQLFYDGPDGTVITADGSIAGTAAAIIERVKADFGKNQGKGFL